MNKSNLKYLCLLAATGMLLVSARAGEVTTTASITFRGTSTLHGFEGTVTPAPFPVIFRKDSETGRTNISATVTVNVADMTTQHNKRDKNMFKMLDAENFTTISGTLTNALIPAEGSGEATVHLKIHGVEQDITATLSDLKIDETQSTCRMEFPVSLAAFGLKPPSVIGLIRVGDTVTVECTLQGTLK